MATSQAINQVEPLATTVTVAYTCPSSKRATVRVLVVNTDSVLLKYRLSLAENGAVDATSQYFVYDETLAGNGSGRSPALVLAETDELRVYTDTATLVCTVNGIEQDV